MRGGGTSSVRAAGSAVAVASLLLVGAAIVGLSGTSCGSSSPTGVHVHVTFEGSVAQLEFAVLSEDRQSTIVPFTARPQTAGGALASPQDVVVYLPETTQTVVCQARAVGTAVGTAESTASVSPHKLVDVYLVLGKEMGDAGADTPGGGADAGGADGPADGADDGATPGLDDGQLCGSARECSSGYCADGVCCNSSCVGTCRACNIAGSLGACTAIPAGQAVAPDECAVEDPTTCGTNGKCNGTGGCQRYTTGTTCKAATCNPVAGALISSSQCDGNGACVAGQTIPCDPFVCDVAARRCYTQCQGNAQCMPGRTCNAQNTCGKKPSGAACSTGGECNTGQCFDGVCCNTDCSGSCLSCSLPGKEGLCSPLPAGGVDPRHICSDMGVANCGTNGLCNGVGGCQMYAAGSICAPRRCGTQKGQEVAARTCDGAGHCVGGATATCALSFACNPATGSCFSGACTADNQCVNNCNVRNGRCREP